jgi:AraC family transcriptional regulator of adaptative response/methylated-DNA-[protein]-cysteine methyltransferase
VAVAWSDEGLRAVVLGDRAGPLIEDLRRRFPAAKPADDSGHAVLAAVLDLIASPRARCELPLAPAGTDFQHRVWQALRAIPPGGTASYREIAAAIGRPGSSRAVAGACAANPLAVVVPCHRVVRSDGSLSGYRWGVDRKRRLLERERGN